MSDRLLRESDVIDLINNSAYDLLEPEDTWSLVSKVRALPSASDASEKTAVIRAKCLTDTAILPHKSTSGSAGYDLCADIDSALVIHPQECVKIGTGLALEIPTGYFGGIFARSGLATKQGLRPPMCVGVVDSDYRGNVSVSLYNDSNDDQTVIPHSRIAQLIIIPCLNVEYIETDDLSETERGAGGFGSTGTR